MDSASTRRYLAAATKALHSRRADARISDIDIAAVSTRVSELAARYHDADAAEVFTPVVSAILDIVTDRISLGGNDRDTCVRQFASSLRALDAIPVDSSLREGRYSNVRETVLSLASSAASSANHDTPAAPEQSEAPRRRRLGRIITVCVAVAVAAAAGWWLWYKHLGSDLDALAANPSEEAYELYLTDHPDSPLTARAAQMYTLYMDSVIRSADELRPGETAPLARMHRVATTLGLPADVSAAILADVARHADSLYHIAATEGSLDAWMRYQSMVPESRLRDSAERVDSLERLTWSTDAGAWQYASRLDTRQALTKYVEMYPHGVGAAKARSRLVDLEVNSYRSHGRDILGSMEKVADRDIPGSRVCIYNNSDYDVTFLFSGATSSTLHVTPHDYEEIDIADGEYKVLTKVDNAAHDRFSFDQTFSRGVYMASIELTHKSDS